MSTVSTGTGDYLRRVYHPGIYPGHSGPLSLAIPPWVGAMSIGDGFGHCRGRNGEFCVAIDPVTRTAGLLYASLTRSNPRRLKGERG